MLLDEPPTVSPPSVAPAYCTCRGDVDADPGDRSYLVLAKPNVIMNDTRLRGLAVAGSDVAGRRGPHNHAQTARNLSASYAMQPLAPAESRRRGWTANRLPSRHPWPMHSKSFTDWSAASIDVCDAIRYAPDRPGAEDADSSPDSSCFAVYTDLVVSASSPTAAS
jgi:hypothetical protein